MNTVVGLFENRSQAEAAKSALAQANIATSGISLYDQTVPAPSGESEQGFWESVKHAFGFGEDRGFYEEGIRRGGTVVSVRIDDHQTNQAAEILSRQGAVDIDTHAKEWRTAGWTGGPAKSDRPKADETIPVVQEELQVGKRAVRRGKTIVYRQVSEKPVEETIRLHDEVVRVERHPVEPQRGASGVGFDEKTVEVIETHEEPVISKQARVVEEVTIQKDVKEREETIRDTVKRADVHVEREGASADAPVEEDAYRQHWTAHYGSGHIPYEQYLVAYRYGSALRGNKAPSASPSSWTDVEAHARRDWEEQNTSTWDRFKDAIRYAWEQPVTAGKRRAA
jgi:uncharacterized protein (TIGR02271 family)